MFCGELEVRPAEPPGLSKLVLMPVGAAVWIAPLLALPLALFFPSAAAVFIASIDLHSSAFADISAAEAAVFSEAEMAGFVGTEIGSAAGTL